MGAYLEISTATPCILRCKFCPQDVLEGNYNSNIKQLSLNNFVKVVNKIPENSKIIFSGFNEPFQNEEVVDMILYAYKRNYKIKVNTTLVGLSIEKYIKINKLEYLDIGIHLPDSEGKTVVKLTEKYKELLKYIVDNPPAYLKFNHHEGVIHDEIKNIVEKSQKLLIHNRCGLLQEGQADYHPNVSRCKHEFQFTNDRGACVLLPNGDCVTCCHAFDLSGYLGNLFTQTWEEIEASIKPIELCKHCIDAIEC